MKNLLEDAVIVVFLLGNFEVTEDSFKVISDPNMNKVLRWVKVFIFVLFARIVRCKDTEQWFCS